MRLANSTIENEGRIEVCRQGTWGPICGAGVVEAYFACRALGFDAGMHGYTYTTSIHSLFTYSLCLVYLHRIICSSTTTLLQLRVW